ncbi:hypothetical protein K227x_55530 [Rubripirellula lacrimiformis]|uniref:Uncharacterized protein n=1 Tax=Rubripirellula lacrimiformis TaxID=1930273 RepID=A0A517NJ53_9BACT|nr:hypothetical protein [Rubripirellula lacrimiformis]QDT07128.1 hypothetical protein K227x_55530 [Rubripirellula lacrimiformis]
MKFRSIHTLVPALAVALTTFCGSSAEAQEYIVSEQVVSDVKVEGGFTGSQYAGDYGSQGEVVSSGSGNCASGNCGGSYVGDMSGGVVNRSYGQPDLFYNYYTKGNANGVNAKMYVSPMPVPANVGHTHMTYQPFYPEEMLYWHKNKFHNNYDNGRGMNRTRAMYYSPPVRQTASNLYWNFLRIPR